MSLEQRIQKALEEKQLPPALAEELKGFYHSYLSSSKIASPDRLAEAERLFATYADLFFLNLAKPFSFSPYHEALRAPVNYRKMGLEFFSLLVDKKRSGLLNKEFFLQAEKQLEQGENVFLLANHQSEADPQLLYILLHKEFPLLAERVIFMAGHRVTTDPVAVPFSMGCHLLCIYSKKYIELQPEHRAERTTHNQRAMGQMRELLDRGGACIYMAPSGGRDRSDETGRYVPAHFDPSSLEMAFLQGKRGSTKTHFYPLTLLTYEVLPPPQAVKKELGEMRITSYAPIFAALGEEIDPNEESLLAIDRKERREVRARQIWEGILRDYERLEKMRAENV